MCACHPHAERAGQGRLLALFRFALLVLSYMSPFKLLVGVVGVALDEVPSRPREKQGDHGAKDKRPQTRYEGDNEERRGKGGKEGGRKEARKQAPKANRWGCKVLMVHTVQRRVQCCITTS